MCWRLPQLPSGLSGTDESPGQVSSSFILKSISPDGGSIAIFVNIFVNIFYSHDCCAYRNIHMSSMAAGKIWLV